MSVFKRGSAVFVSAALLLASLSTAAAPTYRVLDLGKVEHTPGMLFATAMNDKGVTVGSLASHRQSGPIRFGKGRPVNLALEAGLVAISGAARAINRDGMIAGEIQLTPGGMKLPFIDQDGAMTVLQMPTGVSGVGVALSDRGDLVAVGPSGLTRPKPQRTFVRGPTGVWTALETLPDGHDTVGTAINIMGSVVGYISVKNRWQAVTWHGITPQIIPGTESFPSARALAINDHGDIAGEYFDSGIHGFLLRDGSLTVLNTEAEVYTIPKGIDELGRVVGYKAKNGEGANGFLYEDGVLNLLDNLLAPEYKGVWHIEDAVAINDRGEIAANGYTHQKGQYRALLLKPLPAD